MAVDTELGTLRKAFQDLIAPELRELKADLLALHAEVVLRADATQKQLDQRFDAERQHTGQRFDAERQYTDQRFNQVDQRFDAIMVELRHARERADAQAQAMRDSFTVLGLQLEMTNLRTFSDFATRLAALEARLALNP